MSADRKQRIKEMRDICIPKKDLFTDLTVNKLYTEIGFLFTRVLVKTRVTPNQITWFWGIMLIVSSLLFLSGDLWIRVLGAALWVLLLSMDWTDGQVARYKKMTSKRGAFLDGINHCVTWPILFICIGLGLYFSTGEILNVVFAFLAGMFMPLIMLTMNMYKSVAGDQIKESSENEDAEEKFFKNEKRFKRIRNINPLTFMNMYIVLLIVTLLDAILPEIFPSIFPFELFWMTGFLSLSVLFYGVGFALGFFARAGILYKRLT